MNGITTEVAPGLIKLQRDSGAVLWIAYANQITFMSYSESYAREWLARESDNGPEAA